MKQKTQKSKNINKKVKPINSKKLSHFPKAILIIIGAILLILIAFYASNKSDASEQELVEQIKTLSSDDLKALSALSPEEPPGAIAGLATASRNKVKVGRVSAPANQAAQAARTVLNERATVKTNKNNYMTELKTLNDQVRSMNGPSGSIAKQQRDQAAMTMMSELGRTKLDFSKNNIISEQVNLGCILLQAHLENELGRTYRTEITGLPQHCNQEDIIKDQLIYNYCAEITSMQSKNKIDEAGWVPLQGIARQTACLSEKQVAKLSKSLHSGSITVGNQLAGFGREEAKSSFLTLMTPVYILIFDADKHRGAASDMYKLLSENKNTIKTTIQSKGYPSSKVALYDRVTGQLVGAKICKAQDEIHCANPSTLMDSVDLLSIGSGSCQLGDMVANGPKPFDAQGAKLGYTCPSSPCGGAGATGGAGGQAMMQAGGKQAGAAKPGQRDMMQQAGPQGAAAQNGIGQQSLMQSMCSTPQSNGGFGAMMGDDGCMASLFTQQVAALENAQNGAARQMECMTTQIAGMNSPAADPFASAEGMRQQSQAQRGNPLGGGCELSAGSGDGVWSKSKYGYTSKDTQTSGNTKEERTWNVIFKNGEIDHTVVKDRTTRNGAPVDQTWRFDKDGSTQCSGDCGNDPTPPATDNEVKQKEAEAEAKAKADREAAAKAPAPAAASCADPDSCSSSCTGPNQQAINSGQCSAGAAQPQGGPPAQGQAPGRAGVAGQPQQGDNARGGAVNNLFITTGTCSSPNGQGSEGSVCAQVRCGESSMAANSGAANMGGMAFVTDSIGGGRRGGSGGEVVISGGTGRGAARLQQSLNCCGLNAGALQRSMTMDRQCEAMRCAEDAGDCSCDGTANAPVPAGLGGEGGTPGVGTPDGGPAAARR